MSYNREHPGLMKNLFGLSHVLLHRKLGWLGEAEAYRLPAFVVAAIVPAVSYRFGAMMYGRLAGLFAALSFLLIPRQFFNAHLAAFDVPVMAFWLLTVYWFWRAQHSKHAWLACGLAFGLGLATKHNTFFLPIVPE
jgi:4-amino-4-deoxy-L-arabinose transferase-like glycosyltransferase